MDYLFIFLCILAIAAQILQLLMKSKEEEKEERMENEKQSVEASDPKPDTAGLMHAALGEIGCRPTVNEDGSFFVQYQGETFHIQFGGVYARVWDPAWAEMRADDPELPKLQAAVNMANFEFGPTVVMSRVNDNGIIHLHSRRDIMLHPACPDNVEFVRAVLDTFFDTKANVRKSFNELKERENAGPRPSRRPIGFDTTTQGEGEE